MKFCVVDDNPYDLMIVYENRHKNVKCNLLFQSIFICPVSPIRVFYFLGSVILKFLGGYGVEVHSGQDRAC